MGMKRSATQQRCTMQLKREGRNTQSPFTRSCKIESSPSMPVKSIIYIFLSRHNATGVRAPLIIAS